MDISIYKGRDCLENLDDNALLFAVTPDCEIIVAPKKELESVEDWNDKENLNYCTEQFYSALTAVILKTMGSIQCKEIDMWLPVDNELTVKLTAELMKIDPMNKINGDYLQ